MRIAGRTILALTSVLALAASVPALAQDDGYGYRFQPGGGDWAPAAYMGLRGSLAFSGTASTTVPTAPPTALRASYNTGGGGSVYIGAHLPLGFRFELEGLYRYLPFNQVALNGTASVAHGQAQIGAPMVNLLWDLPLDFPVRPFIGAGIGGAYTAADLRNPANTTTYLKSDHWGLAYQLMGGAELPLSANSRFTAMYRWLQLDGVHGACGTSGAASLTCKSDLNSQSVDLGLEMDL